MDKQLLIVKANIFLRDKEYRDLYKSIEAQRNNGTIVLPSYCEALIVPDNVEIKAEAPKYGTES